MDKIIVANIYIMLQFKTIGIDTSISKMDGSINILNSYIIILQGEGYEAN